MKKVVLTLVALGAFCFTYNDAAAQKIAYVYSDTLIQLMPETAGANKKLEEYAKQLTTHANGLDSQYNGMVEEYNKKKETWAPAIRELKEQDIMAHEQKIKTFQEKAQQDLMNKRQELFAPVIQKAKSAITEVAKEKGYSYVLDASLGMILFSTPGDNIIADVKKKLAIH